MNAPELVERDLVDWASYNKNGFFKLKDVIPHQAIDDLCRYFEKSLGAQPKPSRGKHIDSNNISETTHHVLSDEALRHSPAFEIANAIADEYFSAATSCSFDHLIQKRPQSPPIDWHQDQIYKKSVRRMKTIHFWIPLQDTPVELAPMEYLPGSHLSDELVSHTEKDESSYLGADVSNDDVKEAVLMPCKKGDMLIHHPMVLHRSLANTTQDTVRYAWILHFSPHGRLDRFFPSNVWHGLLTTVFGRPEVVKAKR